MDTTKDVNSDSEATIPKVKAAYSMDADDIVQIGCSYRKISVAQIAVAMPLIYIPLFTLVPFAVVSSLFVYWHLRLLGGRNIKTYWDFVPEWVTHRYTLDDQITTNGHFLAPWVKTRLFWVFNCKLYCPLSVALFSWLSYLVKLVENWWCPFNHEKKPSYDDARIDESFWHITEADKALLHEDDRENAIWNNVKEESENSDE